MIFEDIDKAFENFSIPAKKSIINNSTDTYELINDFELSDIFNPQKALFKVARKLSPAKAKQVDPEKVAQEGLRRLHESYKAPLEAMAQGKPVGKAFKKALKGETTTEPFNIAKGVMSKVFPDLELDFTEDMKKSDPYKYATYKTAKDMFNVGFNFVTDPLIVALTAGEMAKSVKEFSKLRKETGLLKEADLDSRFQEAYKGVIDKLKQSGRINPVEFENPNFTNKVKTDVYKTIFKAYPEVETQLAKTLGQRGAIQIGSRVKTQAGIEGKVLGIDKKGKALVQMAKGASKIPLNKLSEIRKTKEQSLREAEKISKPLLPTKTKPIIRKTTGQYRVRDVLEKTAEDLTKELYQTKEKVFDIQQAQKLKNRTSQLIKSINRYGNIKNIDQDYKQKIDDILGQYDLKKRTEKTLKRRESLREFIKRQEDSGEIIGIPDDIIDMAERKSLNDLNLDDLVELKNSVGILAHQGVLKNKLIAGRESRDLFQTTGNLVNSIKQEMISRPRGAKSFEMKEYLAPSQRQKGITDKLKAINAEFTKAETIIDSLDGFKPNGVAYNEIFKKIKIAEDQEFSIGNKVYSKLEEIFKPFEKNMNTWSNEEFTLSNDMKLTKQELLSIYANSNNPLNVLSLVEGNKLSPEIINEAISLLSNEEKILVDNVRNLMDEVYPMVQQVTKKLTGIMPAKTQGYYPKIYDREYSDRLVQKQQESDLMKNVIRKTFVERGFTKERKKVKDAIDLNFFPNIVNHFDDVIHFVSHALPIRDVQKIMNQPIVKDAIGQSTSPESFKQLQTWLRDVANPQLSEGTANARTIGMLRKNATTVMLGLKATVSLLQFGSIFQTIDEIGLGNTAQGLKEFYKNPRKNIEFINSKSQAMKNRGKTFDRDLKELMKSKSAMNLVVGKRDMRDFFYSLIHLVDKSATYPTWLSAYNKEMAMSKDEKMAIDYADKVVRQTQPTGSMKDLSAIQRGKEYQKILTMFYTHFSNLYQLLQKSNTKFRRGYSNFYDFIKDYWWLIISPAMYASIVRNGMKKGLQPKEMLKQTASYGLASIPVVGQILGSALSGFEPSVTPLADLPSQVYKLLNYKKPLSKVKAATNIAGHLIGLPSRQFNIMLEGLIDLSKGKTRNPLRLIFSKHQLGEKKKEPFKEIDDAFKEIGNEFSDIDKAFSNI